MGIEKDPCLERIGCADPEILDDGEHLAAEFRSAPSLSRISRAFWLPPSSGPSKRRWRWAAQSTRETTAASSRTISSAYLPLQAMGDPLKVGYEQALHLQGNAVLEDIDALGRKLRPYLPQAIGCMLAVCGASEIHP